MASTTELLMAALPAAACGAFVLWWMNRPARTDPGLTPAVRAEAGGHGRWPAHALPVLAPDTLIQATGTGPVLLDIRRRSGLTDPTWETHVAPVIHATAQMLQQLPASEAHHHAQPGGLWIHTIETLGHAARLRQGRILPPGADIETQGRTQHMWTVGLYIAALLHDIGKPVTDLRVTLFSDAQPAGAPWHALTGSMSEAGASAYVVDFKRAAERDYQAHQRIGVQLLQRLVPSETRIWLSQDESLFNALFEYLSGGTGGPIADIVREAEAESVRRNLATGSRIRFATSRTTPLIERLMQALRSMLAEGGRLPLNRPGAAGFSDGDDLWFAAVRLANDVRDWLRATYPDEPVPGETMNDRLFDTWQEYGACKVNPDTQGVIWSAQIVFDSGQTLALGALLRFPLALLYPDASHYPKPLAGRIVLKAGATAEATPPPGAPSADTRPTAPGWPAPDPIPVAAPDAEQPGGTGAMPDPGPPGAMTQAATAPSPLAPGATTDGSAGPANNQEAPRLPNLQNVNAALKAVRKSRQGPAAPAPMPAAKPLPASSPSPEAAPSQVLDSLPPPDGPAYLDEEDQADEPPRLVARTVPTPPRFTGAVVPHVALPASPPEPTKKAGGKKSAGPTDAALRFMGWLQQGLAEGALPYNQNNALVHFVRVNLRGRDEMMMLLVSPAVFRRFAEQHGDPDGTGPVNPAKLGMGIQTDFTRAGWHHPAARGRNIHRFQVIRRGDSGGSLLNGFLVVEPERFVNPVPPGNDRLSYWPVQVGAMDKTDAAA